MKALDAKSHFDCNDWSLNHYGLACTNSSKSTEAYYVNSISIAILSRII